jgi:hypothetical protein
VAIGLGPPLPQIRFKSFTHHLSSRVQTSTTSLALCHCVFLTASQCVASRNSREAGTTVRALTPTTLTRGRPPCLELSEPRIHHLRVRRAINICPSDLHPSENGSPIAAGGHGWRVVSCCWSTPEARYRLKTIVYCLLVLTNRLSWLPSVRQIVLILDN